MTPNSSSAPPYLRLCAASSLAIQLRLRPLLPRALLQRLQLPPAKLQYPPLQPQPAQPLQLAVNF
jgi:hypothetical protein